MAPTSIRVRESESAIPPSYAIAVLFESSGAADSLGTPHLRRAAAIGQRVCGPVMATRRLEVCSSLPPSMSIGIGTNLRLDVTDRHSQVLCAGGGYRRRFLVAKLPEQCLYRAV